MAKNAFEIYKSLIDSSLISNSWTLDPLKPIEIKST